MEDPGMSDDSEELVNARPGNRPGQRAFRQALQDLEGRPMVQARFNFGVNEDVGVNRLHGLAPIHEVEQGVAVQQIDPGLLRRLPALKPQAVRFLRTRGQRAPKKVVRDGLQCPALFGGFLLQLAGEADRQSSKWFASYAKAYHISIKM